jgi:predicted Zn-dependent peptidase
VTPTSPPRPAAALVSGWHFPSPAVAHLPNGLTIWSYHLPGQYVVAADLLVDVPLTAEPAAAEGVATIAARGLDEGTPAHPGPAFAAALEAVGAQYSGWAMASATLASLEVPAQWFEPGLALFAEGVTAPEFADADVERLVANRLAEIDQTRAAARRLAAWLIRETILAPGQRSARPVGGSRATVAAVDAAAVRAFHAAHYGPAGATLVIAGDLSGVDVAAAVERAFGAWAPAGPAVADEAPVAAAPRSRLVHRPGAVQADIRLGWFGLDRSDPRWAAFQVALTAMGGGFSSRLNQKLREEKGWTYDVSVGNRSFRHGGLTTLATATQTANAAAVIEEARAITSASTPFTATEVSDAIGFLVGVAPLNFSTADAVAGHAGALAAHGLPHEAADQSLQALAAVTPDEATAAWAEVVATKTPNLVILGNADELSGPLALDPEPIPEL